MTKFFTMFAIVATMGTVILGAATLANANTGPALIDYPGYPGWADDALAPKGNN